MEEDGDDKDDSKRKSRNLSEKKRRDQFNALVNDLSTLISTSNRKMDKSTVLKSTIAFLKHHNEATDRSKVYEIEQDWKPAFLTNDEFTHLMLESLDGFIIVFSSNGSIFYASESITSLLGYLPSDLLNMSIYDLCYELDHESLLNAFMNPKPVIEPMQTDITSSNQISFCLHLKRGKIEKSDAEDYELVKFVGYFRNDVNLDSAEMKSNSNNEISLKKVLQMHPTVKLDRKLIFVGTGRVQTPQLIREMSVIDSARNEFTSKHSMEWKFLFLDHRAPPIIGYMPFEVLGTSGYDYYHFDDLDNIVACHEELMQKGEGKSCYYRFLTKGQQWIWLQTDFYVSYHQFNAKPDYVVCNHKVVSYTDVLRQSRGGGSVDDSQKHMSSKSTEGSVKSATLTLHDYEVSSSQSTTQTVNDSRIQNPSSIGGNSSSVSISTNNLSDTVASLNMDSIWASAGLTDNQQPPMRSSRHGSSYGNISSTGASPTLKRKRYMNHRGNDSDSTSMSTDPIKQSMMTHMSMGRHRQGVSLGSNQQGYSLHPPHSSSHTTNLFQQYNQQTTQTGSFHHLSHSQLQTHGHSQTHSQHGQGAQQKITPVVAQHPIIPAQVVTSAPCQFQANESSFAALRSPQIVAPTFLEPPQYLTAIPLQPIIAPFPVAPVLSPMTNQAEVIPNAVVITPTQVQLQEQLQRKHDELQKLIMQQQDELRMVSEQLLLARYTLLQPVVSMTEFNTMPNTAGSGNVVMGQPARHFNLSTANGPTEAYFGQYGFAMATDPITGQTGQHIVVTPAQQPQSQHQQQQQQQQQHHLQQQQQKQQQQNLASGSQHLVMTSLQQQQQQNVAQQQRISTARPHAQQQQQHQQAQHLHHQQPSSQTTSEDEGASFMSRSVPDLDQFGQDDIDAFLNLSPLPSIASSQSALSQMPMNGSHINNNNGSTILTAGGESLHSSLSRSFAANSTAATVATANEDSLLSYMQLNTDSSPTLRFPMGLHEDESDTQSDDNKLLPNSHSHPRSHHQTTPRNPTNSFFGSTSFRGHLNSSGTVHALPSELEVLPYQLSTDHSQNIFESSADL